MAETREIRSKPSRLRQQKISGGIQTVNYVTIVRGDVVDGNIFQPQGLNLQAEIDVYSKIPSEKYTTLSLTNPDLVRVDEKTGELYALSGRVINGKFTPSIIATPEEQKFSDSLERLAIESAVESIKTDKNNYVDRSNLNQNVANTPESQGDLTSKGTQPSEKGGDSRTATPFIYPKVTNSLILSFPENMSEKQDMIEFSVWKYSDRNINNPQTSLPEFSSYSPGKEPYVEASSEKVYLPISNKIQDNNSVVWNQGELNEFQRRIADISLQAMQGKRGAVDSTLALLHYAKSSDAFGNMVRSYLAGQAIGVGGLLTRATGAIFNPNLELLFQGPALRDFAFSFLLIGKSESESKKIKKIIKFFKKNMAVRDKVEGNNNGFFLNSPYVFGIKYLKEQGDHPSINKIKKCALQNFSVDYTPMGSYMTYTDGSMFGYSLSMQFKELTPIYSSDYTDNESIDY